MQGAKIRYINKQWKIQRKIANYAWQEKNKISGSGALSGKMLHVSIVENNKIDHYFRAGQVK